MLATRTPHSRPAARRGVILLVVLTMLALFAIVGISFVMYADAEALSSRMRREAEDQPDDVPDPTPFVNNFLRQLIYPVGDTGQDTTSALRGHDLGRGMYGYNPNGPNLVAYSGIGTFTDPNFASVPNIGATGLTDRRQVINNSIRNTTGGLPLFDPERVVRTDPNVAPLPTTMFIGKNAGYTYPDRNNMAVGVINPQSGEVVVPSFLRPTLFNPNRNINGAGNVAMNAASWLAPPQSSGLVNHDGLTDAQSEWMTETGRYKMLFPRPVDQKLSAADVSQYPYPPMNPDGTYTGYVQNNRFHNGPQRMDSSWMWANMPVMNWKGKQITALVAPLIIPLNGSVNMTVASNRKGTGQTHAGAQGFGPWEINLAGILPNGTDAQTVRQYTLGYNGSNPNNPAIRGVPAVTSAYFVGNATAKMGPQDYGRVNWDGVGSMSPLRMPGTMPGPLPFKSDPAVNAEYDTGYGNGTGTELTTHPSLFNPFQWQPGSSPAQLFLTRDLWRLRGRYADRASNYPSPFLGLSGNHSLSGNTPNNPANERRALLTTISNSHGRPALGVNFTDDTAGAGGYSYVMPPPGPPIPPPGIPPLLTPQAAALPTLLSTATGGPVTDILVKNGTPVSLRSLRAFLGGVNLNRPLADYRSINSVSMVNPGNMATMVARNQIATNDRVALARDIFTRLVVATGAKAVYDPSSGQLVLPTPGGPGTYTLNGNLIVNAQNFAFNYTVSQQEYDALRYLAQLAVNIVDYIDEDDIMTAFAWNTNAPAADVFNRYVFGVEKSKLAINEVYSELANDAGDRAPVMQPMNPFKARFWIELVNPGNAESDPNGPLAGPDTSSPQYYGSIPFRFGPATPVYRVEVYQNGQAVRDSLYGPFATQNVRGDVFDPMTPGAPLPPQLQVDSNGFITGDPGQSVLADRIEPNNGQFRAIGNGRRFGFAVCGPEVAPLAAMGNSDEFAPDYMTDPIYNMMLVKPNNAMTPQNQLQYDVALANEMDLNTTVVPQLTDHAVVLRRLANPYMPWQDNPANPNYNPFITVDATSYVRTRDAVRIVTPPAGQMDGTRMSSQPEPFSARYAYGRVQPLTGHATRLPPIGMPAMPPEPDYPISLTVRQQPVPPKTAEPQHSLFAHNAQQPAAGPNPVSDATLQFPFEWLTHLDRRIISPMELLHVSGVKPHELTYRFATPAAGGPGAIRPQFHQHTPPWFAGNSLLARGLDAMTIKPWTVMMPDGGRTAGAINVNMVWDIRVLNALLDPQASNGFTATEINTLWNSVFVDPVATSAATKPGLRTKRFPNVSPTIDEEPLYQYTADGSNTGPDRPFRSLGSGMFSASATGMIRPEASTQPSLAPGIEDTIFRTGSVAPGAPPLFRMQPPTPNPSSLRTHPYTQWEALRKASNNLTTTSDTYLVLMTVGYFEVRGYDPNMPAGMSRPILGKEVFNEISGDMRVQFAGVIDRSQLAVTDPTVADSQQAEKIFFAELSSPVTVSASTPGPVTVSIYCNGQVPAAGTPTELGIFYEGRTYLIKTTATGANEVNTLYLGTGGDAIKLTVTNTTPFTFDPMTGIGTFPAVIADANIMTTAVDPLAAGTSRTYPAGSALGSAILGNPGPQGSFDYTMPQFKTVVPYLNRLVP